MASQGVMLRGISDWRKGISTKVSMTTGKTMRSWNSKNPISSYSMSHLKGGSSHGNDWDEHSPEIQAKLPPASYMLVWKREMAQLEGVQDSLKLRMESPLIWSGSRRDMGSDDSNTP